jgi:hypothetical protein
VLECGSGVLEELLLPTVEHRGVNAVLVAQIRNRGVFEEMEPKYGDLLRDAEATPSFLGHGKRPLEIVAYSSALFFPFRLKQNKVDQQAGEFSGSLAVRWDQSSASPSVGRLDQERSGTQNHDLRPLLCCQFAYVARERCEKPMDTRLVSRLNMCR